MIWCKIKVVIRDMIWCKIKVAVSHCKCWLLSSGSKWETRNSLQVAYDLVWTRYNISFHTIFYNTMLVILFIKDMYESYMHVMPKHTTIFEFPLAKIFFWFSSIPHVNPSLQISNFSIKYTFLSHPTWNFVLDSIFLSLINIIRI